MINSGQFKEEEVTPGSYTSLSTPRERPLKLHYQGERMSIKDLLFRVVLIEQFETLPSHYDPSKETAVIQLVWKNPITKKMQRNVIFTESYDVVNTLTRSLGLIENKHIFTKFTKPKTSRKISMSPVTNVNMDQFITEYNEFIKCSVEERKQLESEQSAKRLRIEQECADADSSSLPF